MFAYTPWFRCTVIGPSHYYPSYVGFSYEVCIQPATTSNKRVSIQIIWSHKQSPSRLLYYCWGIAPIAQLVFRYIFSFTDTTTYHDFTVMSTLREITDHLEKIVRSQMSTHGGYIIYIWNIAWNEVYVYVYHIHYLVLNIKYCRRADHWPTKTARYCSYVIFEPNSLHNSTRITRNLH